MRNSLVSIAVALACAGCAVHPTANLAVPTPSHALTRDQETAKSLHEMELEAQQIRQAADEKEAAAWRKLLIEENERLRREWLAAGNPEKPGDMAYMVDAIAKASIELQERAKIQDQAKTQSK